MNIYQKMLAITADVSTVAKNLTVGDGKSKYKAVGEADVLAAVKPIEGKYGVYSYPVSRRVIDSGEMTSVKEYNGKQVESKRLYLRVETVYRFVNVEAPEEYLDITTYGDGVDSQDKAPGKAMTYSDKYALLKAYKIQTGDDPDQTASEPLQGVSHDAPKPAQDTTKPASPMVKGVIEELCKKHKVPLKVWLTQERLDWDTLTAADAGKMLASLKQKFEDK